MQELIIIASLFVMNAAPFPCVSNLPAPISLLLTAVHTYRGMKFPSHFIEISQDHLEIYDHLESDCHNGWPQGLIGYRSRMVDFNNSEDTVSWVYSGLQSQSEKLIHLRLWT